MISNLHLCKHKWTSINKTHFDKLNWITIEKCRRCSKLEMATWTIAKENGKIQTTCHRTTINPTIVDGKTGEITDHRSNA